MPTLRGRRAIFGSLHTRGGAEFLEALSARGIGAPDLTEPDTEGRYASVVDLKKPEAPARGDGADLLWIVKV